MKHAPFSYRKFLLPLLFVFGVGASLSAVADGGHGGGGGHAGGGGHGYGGGGGHYAGGGGYRGYGGYGGGHWGGGRWGGEGWGGGRYWGGGPWYRGDWGWGLGLGLGVGAAAWALAADPLYYNPYPWGVGYSYYNPYPATVVVTQPGPPVSPQGTTYLGSTQQNQSWFYCESARGYYPYVPQCPEPWRAVPAMPPGAVQQ